MKGDQKVQMSSYKIRHRDIMCSMGNIVNNTLLHISKLQRKILKVLISKKKKISITMYGDGC